MGISLGRTAAEATHFKGYGPDIKCGKSTSRLLFSSAATPESPSQLIASVYVETIGEGKNIFAKIWYFVKKLILSQMDKKFVKYEFEGKPLFVNVGSIARLGIKPDNVLKCRNNPDQLNRLISSSFNKCIEIEKNINDMFNGIPEQNVDKRSEIFGTEIVQRQRTLDDLRKTITQIFYEFTVAENRNNEEGYVLTNGYVLRLKHTESQTLPIATLFTTQILGEGSYGLVQVAYELSSQRFSIVKIAKSKKGQKDAENEHLILTEIQRDGPPHVGIQKAPYDSVNVSLKSRIDPNDVSRSLLHGYLAYEYEGGNLSDHAQNIPTMTPQKRQNCMRQLLQGLATLEEKQIAHGDIKPDNCYLGKDSENIECVIADFGGATSLKESVGLPSTFTAKYVCENDRKAYVALENQVEEIRTTYQQAQATYEQIKKGEITFEQCKQLRDELQGLLIKHTELIKQMRTLILQKDVYAMGMTLEEFFRCECIVLNDSNVNRAQELFRLRNSMINPSWKHRISAQQALTKFQEFFE